MRGGVFVLLYSLSICMHAQSFNVKIIDEQNQPIIGAHVLNATQQLHAHSDQQGQVHFIEINLADSLIFSHIGFEPYVHIVEFTDGTLSIQLKSNITSLEEIVISSQRNVLDDLVQVDISLDPVNSSQEVLTRVPGLFVGQHAGGGKAEQIFLRGFDVDHGTDVAIAVDGLPVNLVSHAHGQGYADLHFLIPETIDQIRYGKGPYYSSEGNFNTAGYVNFESKEYLNESEIKIERGQFNTNRFLGLFKLVSESKNKSYIASELLQTDGPFESPQNFLRVNIFGKYSHQSESNKWNILLSHFKSQWNASGQIPERSVNNGAIGRFGAIDDTEGGFTSRTNASLSYKSQLSHSRFFSSQLYFSHYDFDLYSNFTFFLLDPVNGDQIRQKEERELLGFKADFENYFTQGSLDGDFKLGIALRNDLISNNELSSTKNRREILKRIRLGDINETSISAYFQSNLDIRKWRINPGLRFDWFEFLYIDLIDTSYQSADRSASIISPKISIEYNHSSLLQLFLKAGKGFHTNDSRLVSESYTSNILPAAYGFDVGSIWKPVENLLINTAIWYLYLEQEFVYVGDAGIVEPSGRSKRKGLDLGFRYQPIKAIVFDTDITYTSARQADNLENANLIPLAPNFTLTSGVSFNDDKGLFGGIHLRWLGDRPANEDGSITAEGYKITDLNLGYVWDKLELNLQAQNVFNVEWKETQFATESRLSNESEPIEEIHFTPGTPRFIKASLSFSF
ncbi:TonB-dependent receptor [Ekhidna sp.]|uniref:TonB-dependent receptor n=1 Tax=Ekhidna sp. TaxID=2608089 RepID=UPI003B50B2B0